jgi:glutathione S-transferase
MNRLTLHSFRRCPFAIRVRMVLEEKKLDYQIKEENLSNPSSELLSMHPEGRVPLLIHDLEHQKHVIYQSSIITEYLDEAFPQIKLMPAEPSTRAEIRLWTYWCDHLFKPDLDLYKYELRSLTESDAESLRERLHQHFTKWETALETGPFIMGSQLTLADIHLFPFARQFMAATPPFPGVEKYLKLNQWLSSMISRSSFEKVMRLRQ